MNYRIHPECTDYIELYSKTTIDFRNDIELINLLKTYKKVIYNCPCPLEWLPDEVINIEVRNTYNIDKIHSEISLYIDVDNDNDDNNDNTYNYYDDIELINQIIKYKKLIYYDYKEINWLPVGITHLEINNLNFNHPLDNLPYSLLCLCITGHKLFYQDSRFKHSLDYLPSGLKCLQIGSLSNDIPLDNLPPGLEYLFIMKYNYKLPLNNLPHSIKILFIVENTYLNDTYSKGLTLIPDEYKFYDSYL